MKLPAFLSFFSLKKLFVFGIFVLLSISLGRTIIVFKERKSEIAHLQDEVNVLSAKVGEKQSELAYRQSDEFIRREAVNQLNWAFPNEVIVFMPDLEEKRKEEESSTSEKKASDTVLTSEPDPYWKQWRTLFFGN